MKKDNYKPLIIVLSIICVVAISVALYTKTDYDFCKLCIKMSPSSSLYWKPDYDYAVKYISLYRNLYFGSIAVAVASGIADIYLLIGSKLKKKETIADSSIKNTMD